MDLESAEKEAFANEVSERLQQFGDLLLDYERHPDNQDLVHQLFRIAHTIKGNAGFVSLTPMVRIAHAAENLFAVLRSGERRPTSEMIGALLECGDELRAILEAFTADESLEKFNPDPLIQKIDALLNDARPAPEAARAGDPQEALVHLRVILRDNCPLPGMRAYMLHKKLCALGVMERVTPPQDAFDHMAAPFEIIFELRTRAPDADLRRALRSHEVQSVELERLTDSAPQPVHEAPPPSGVMQPAQAASAAGEPRVHVERTVASSRPPTLDVNDPELLFAVEAGDPNANDARLSTADFGAARQLEALRVPIRRVDDILNLVGELISANSNYMALAAEFKARYGSKGLYSNFRENSEELSRISAELQEKVMKVRMIPVGTIFSRFRRLVRDFNSAYPDKLTLLEMSGEETEVDKRQIENLYDPLLHLVRNALDHGIESKAERVAAGKPEAGSVRLHSFQSGNDIFIEIEDDGRGLDPEKLRAHAIRQGVASAEELAGMGREDLYELIFAPGFSTAERVTDISGRGVGMDVVRRNVEAVGGRIDIFSTPGVGTKFRITIPLSMAIVTALKTLIEGRLYAIPISYILETLRVDNANVLNIDGVETVRLRESHIPILRVAREIGLEGVPLLQATVQRSRFRNLLRKPVVIVQYADMRVGLLVDELLGYEDLVIKSLSRNYEDVEGLSGAAILGRGEICLVLDVNRLIASSLGRSDAAGFRAAGVRTSARSNGASGLQLAASDAGSRRPSSAALLSATAAAPAAPSSPSSPAVARAIEQGALRSPDELELIKRVLAIGRQNAVRALRHVTANEQLGVRFLASRLQSARKFRDNLLERFRADPSVACYTEYNLTAVGGQALVLTRDNALRLARLMFEDPALPALDAKAISAVREMTNLLAASFTNAMSAAAGVRVLPTTPAFLDPAEQLFQRGPFQAADDARLLLVEAEFADDTDQTLASFYIAPGPGGFAGLADPGAARRSAG